MRSSERQTLKGYDMKKISAVISALVMCICIFTGCDGSHTITGSWQLTGAITIDGHTLSADDIGEMSIEVTEEGDVNIVYGGDERISLWSKDKELFTLESLLSKLDGDTISIPIPELGTLTFTKK